MDLSVASIAGASHPISISLPTLYQLFFFLFNHAILTFTFIDDFIFLLLNFLINSFFLSHIQSFYMGVFSGFAFNYVLMDVFTEAVCSSVILLLIDISFEYDFSMLRNSWVYEPIMVDCGHSISCINYARWVHIHVKSFHQQFLFALAIAILKLPIYPLEQTTCKSLVLCSTPIQIILDWLHVLRMGFRINCGIFKIVYENLWRWGHPSIWWSRYHIHFPTPLEP